MGGSRDLMARLSIDQLRLKGAAWNAPAAAGVADADSSASGGHQAAGGRLVLAQASARREFRLRKGLCDAEGRNRNRKRPQIFTNFAGVWVEKLGLTIHANDMSKRLRGTTACGDNVDLIVPPELVHLVPHKGAQSASRQRRRLKLL